jgi:hypothetical protein
MSTRLFTVFHARRAVPQEVGVYGLGYYTLAVVERCREAGIHTLFVVDDHPEDGPGFRKTATCFRTLRAELRRARVPLRPDTAFFRDVAEGNQLPVMIAGAIENHMDGSASTDPFLRGARRIREVSRGKNRLLHPVALADALFVPAYRKRVALFGFPGSGNILAKHLLADLYQRITAPVPPALVDVAAFAEHYYVSTVLLIGHLFRQFGEVRMELASSQFGTADLTVALPENRYALALHVPSNRHLSTYFYHAHAAPTRPAVDEFARLGAPCVAVIRHPCETILSWASKAARPPGKMLDNPVVFDESVRGLAEWHRQLIANQDRVLVVRYEELIARKKAPLLALAERLGVKLSEAEIEALYDRYLNRDLLPEQAPGHYYRGGNDKWKQYYLPRHVRTFLAQGFEPICAHWQYDLTLPKRSPSAAECVEGGPTGQRRGVLPLDSFFAADDSLECLEPYPLTIRSSSPDISQFIRAAVHGPEFLEHLNAGGLGPKPPPWVNPIGCRSRLPIPYAEWRRADESALATGARRNGELSRA